MSGFEIVGAVAAGCQFAEHLITVGKLIHAVYNQVQDGPAEILQRFQELETFGDIVEQVNSIEPLQTDIAKEIFSRCDRHTHQLTGIFHNIHPATTASLRQRTWKGIVGVAKEEEILKILSTLEREKASLQLHIDAINTYVHQKSPSPYCLDRNQRLTQTLDPYPTRCPSR